MSSQPPFFERPESLASQPGGSDGRSPDGLTPAAVDAPERLPRWPIWAPFAAMVATLVVAGVGIGVITLIFELAGGDSDPLPPGITIAGAIVQDIALIASAVVLAGLLDSPATARQFGFRLPAWGSAVGRTLLIWLGFFVFAVVWSQVIGITENDDLPEELGADDSTYALIAVAVLVCVVAPIAEELFFRGFCFTALRRTLGMLPAALLTGIIFGAIHLTGTDPEFIVPLMVFGTLLCLLYVWTKSLLPCIVLHALNNSLALGVSQDWGAATLLGMAAATAAVLAISVPFARRSRPAPVGM